MAFIASALGMAGSAVAPPAYSPLTATVGFAANEAMPVQIPTPEEAYNAYMQNLMGISRLNRIYAMFGRNLNVTNEDFDLYRRMWGTTTTINTEAWNRPRTTWGQIAVSNTYNPSIDETLFLLRRQEIDYGTARHMIKRNVGGYGSLADAWLGTRYEIPGPSDLIRFAVREGFDPNSVRRFGYNKEFPSAILPWMNKQGYSQDTGIPRPPGSTDESGNPMAGNATWSDLYWWSHWELPSLTQGYEMLHRLYPNSRFGPNPDIINNSSFTPDDLYALQKAQDIPEYWRDKLQAISYHPLTRTDATYLFERDLITEDRFYHSLRSNGYSDQDAVDLLRLGKLRKINNRGINLEKVGKEWVCEQYTLGTIDKVEAANVLKSAGYPVNNIDDFIKVCEINIRSTSLKGYLKQTRIAYVRGAFDEGGLRDALRTMNVNPMMINEYVNRWTFEKMHQYKLSSVAVNTKAYVDGAMTEEAYQEALFNLGYPAVEVTKLISNAKRKVFYNQSKYLQKLNIKIAKDNIARQKELKKTIANAEKEAKAKIKIQENIFKKKFKGMIKASTDNNIKAWYAAKLLSLAEVFYRLYYRDYTRKDAIRYSLTLNPELTESEIRNAYTQAEAEYRREGNPPIVEGD